MFSKKFWPYLMMDEFYFFDLVLGNKGGGRRSIRNLVCEFLLSLLWCQVLRTGQIGFSYYAGKYYGA